MFARFQHYYIIRQAVKVFFFFFFILFSSVKCKWWLSSDSPPPVLLKSDSWTPFLFVIGEPQTEKVGLFSVCTKTTQKSCFASYCGMWWWLFVIHKRQKQMKHQLFSEYSHTQSNGILGRKSFQWGNWHYWAPCGLMDDWNH